MFKINRHTVRNLKRQGGKLAKGLIKKGVVAGLTALGGAAGARFGNREAGKQLGKKLGHATAVAMGTGHLPSMGGYKADAFMRNARRIFKKHARTDEAIQGRLEYKHVGARIGGGSQFIDAINKIKPRQLFSNVAKVAVGGAKANIQKAIRDYGGAFYDEFGRPLSKVPIPMGGFPRAGVDIIGGFGRSYERLQERAANPPYLGHWPQHTFVE